MCVENRWAISVEVTWTEITTNINFHYFFSLLYNYYGLHNITTDTVHIKNKQINKQKPDSATRQHTKASFHCTTRPIFFAAACLKPKWTGITPCHIRYFLGDPGRATEVTSYRSPSLTPLPAACFHKPFSTPIPPPTPFRPTLTPHLRNAPPPPPSPSSPPSPALEGNMIVALMQFNSTAKTRGPQSELPRAWRDVASSAQRWWTAPGKFGWRWLVWRRDAVCRWRTKARRNNKRKLGDTVACARNTGTYVCYGWKAVGWGKFGWRQVCVMPSRLRR